MTTASLVPYSYSPIVDRPPLRWPGGAKVAFYVGLNLEHFRPEVPSTALVEATAGLRPDPLNHGWRDYGSRVGIWRVIETLDRYDVRASALLNSEVLEHQPQVVAAGLARDWAWLAHGRTNSVLHTGLDEDAERTELTEIIAAIETAVGRRPRGWMGPALTETHRTPALLAELGMNYVLDWTADDQPFPLTVPGVWSVPYSVELNDLGIFTMAGRTGPDFLRMVTDHLDQLVRDGAEHGRVMAMALHPFVIGQPSRTRYLDEALALVTEHPDVWVTTSDEILDHAMAAAGLSPMPR